MKAFSFGLFEETAVGIADGGYDPVSLVEVEQEEEEVVQAKGGAADREQFFGAVQADRGNVAAVVSGISGSGWRWRSR